MKKRLTFLGVLCMLLCLCTCAFAAPAIIDRADLFSPEEEMQLESAILSFQKETEMDFLLVTSNEPLSASQTEVADELFDRGGYGLGEEKSGIVYYIDMYERIPYLSTAGAMIDYMTDERIEAAHDASYAYLGSGDYAKAAQTMIDSVARYVAKGIPEGQFQYDVITGQMLTSRHKALTSSEIVVCALIGLVIALLFVKSVQGRYALKGSTYEYSVRENSHVELTGKTDDYLRTTTTRTRKPKDPPASSGSSGGFGSHSGGSSVHHSSSGVRHGGGAGKRF